MARCHHRTVHNGDQRPVGVVRRTVHLGIGAAITIAFFILATSIYAPLQPEATEPEMAIFIPMFLIPMLLVGLLPGVRELQVAGAQSLLGVRDVVVPEPMRLAHRWRTALWTFVHQIIGTIAAVLGLLGIMIVAVLAHFLSRSEPFSIPGLTLDRPQGPAQWALHLGLSVVALSVVVALVWAGGIGARWSAPLLLGPLGLDRLALAEQRLAAEQEYRRLSRDLHDGVGHSLSAISLQAEAGQRLLQRAGSDPRVKRAQQSLQVIADLAAGAVAELDSVLGTLRAETGSDAVSARSPAGTAGAELDRLPALLAAHRERGLEIHTDLGFDAGQMPPVLSRTAYRICAEGLTNAAKYATGPVQLEIHDVEDAVVITLTNPVAAPGSERRRGRGLVGLAETVQMLDGELTAGPQDGQWVLDAELPRGGTRG